MPVAYEVLEGVVQQLGKDDSGLKILERWCNYDSRYTGRHAKPGERVKIRVSNGRFIVALVSEDQELPPEPVRRAGGGAVRTPEEERRIVRQSCLKASIEWASSFESRPTTADVLKLAEKFEQWVYR